MKTITQLTGAPTEAEYRNPHGNICALHLQDENCPGWFYNLTLSPAGLRVASARPNGQAAAIPLSEIVRLFREHAPEVFADDAAIEASRKAIRARDEQGGNQPMTRERLRHPKSNPKQI